MAEYLRRNQVGGNGLLIDCKVSQSALGASLTLPNREDESYVPTGWIPVEMNGSTHEAKFESAAINTVRVPGSEINQLPSILDGWFGPDAGRPGTDFHVQFESREDGWHAGPRTAPGRRTSLQLGQSYRREDVAAVLGTKVVGQTWQSGVVPVGKKRLLFVTLDKKEMDKKYGYRDKFIGNDLFQWQSQNKTAQNNVDGKRIRDHAEQGIEFLLFVRKQGKVKGVTMPFFYCGQVQFVDWEGEKPITVKWKLEQPLSESVLQHLTIPE